MASNREYSCLLWNHWFVVLLSFRSLTTALNNSSTSNSAVLLPTSAIYPTKVQQNTTTPTTHTPLPTTVHTTTTTTATRGIKPSSTYTLPSSSNSIGVGGANSTTGSKPRPNAKAGLSVFGIIMLSLGGVLIVVLVVCLAVICCHGRERGPGGTHVPHSNVKMKPWRSAELSTTNELTEHTVDALDTPNHSQSHQNVGVTNSPSPNLSAPSVNNNTVSTPTGTFRNLSATHPGGDLGEFGRKLSLGRQAYEIPTLTSEVEKTTEHKHEPAQEAKGEQDDMTTIHYV